MREFEKNKDEFYEIISEMTQNEAVQKMKKFRQHYECSCYEHCENVAYISYRICKKLNLDYKAAARAGMVHDLFLYDWRKNENGRKGFHAFTHPKIALENAKKYFEISEKEEDIILKHMWPVTIKFPRYIESYVITIADKISAINEGICYYRKILFSKKALRYAYIFFGLFFIK